MMNPSLSENSTLDVAGVEFEPSVLSGNHGLHMDKAHAVSSHFSESLIHPIGRENQNFSRTIVPIQFHALDETNSARNDVIQLSQCSLGVSSSCSEKQSRSESSKQPLVTPSQSPALLQKTIVDFASKLKHGKSNVVPGQEAELADFAATVLEELPVAADLVVSVDFGSHQPNRKRSRPVETTSLLSSSSSSSEEGSDNELDSTASTSPSNSDHPECRYRSYQVGQWSEKFRELLGFKQQHGHVLVPHKYKYNLPLARWVKRQRYQYKLMKEGGQSTLSQERIQMLEDVGFVWDFQGDAWVEKIADLIAYRQKHSNCDVPCNYAENPRLATWVKCQRRQYKLMVDGKPSSMTPERIHELESLGFRWGLRTHKKRRTGSNSTA